MPSNKKYYIPVKKIKPEDVNADLILADKSHGFGYKIKRNPSGKPTEIAIKLGLFTRIYDTKKYTIYALIRIERILEGTDGDKRTRQNLSRAKMRLNKNSYLP
jgi:hypothetical protein